jgi:hypothetical protein
MGVAEGIVATGGHSQPEEKNCFYGNRQIYLNQKRGQDWVVAMGHFSIRFRILSRVQGSNIFKSNLSTVPPP